MTFLLIAAAWLAVSIPLSVATGRLLAKRSAELEEVGR